MLRVFLISLVLLFTTSNLSAQHPDTTNAKNDPIVYITRHGSHYHRDSCRFLSKSKIPLPLSEAKRYYKPCKVCKPPE